MFTNVHCVEANTGDRRWRSEQSPVLVAQSTGCANTSVDERSGLLSKIFVPYAALVQGAGGTLPYALLLSSCVMAG